MHRVANFFTPEELTNIFGGFFNIKTEYNFTSRRVQLIIYNSVIMRICIISFPLLRFEYHLAQKLLVRSYDKNQYAYSFKQFSKWNK